MYISKGTSVIVDYSRDSQCLFFDFICDDIKFGKYVNKLLNATWDFDLGIRNYNQRKE